MMNMNLLVTTFALTLSACVSVASVGKSEIAALKTVSKDDIATLGGNVIFASALSEKYIEQSDTAARAQDIASIAIIGAAATAAGGLLYGAHMDLVKGAGLGAGTLVSLNNYAQPAAASKALLIAAERLVCISKMGKKHSSTLNSDQDFENLASGVLGSGIRQVRIQLRKGLLRQPPDYNAILAQMRIAATPPAKITGVSESGNEVILAKALQDLEAGVATCLLINL